MDADVVAQLVAAFDKNQKRGPDGRRRTAFPARERRDYDDSDFSAVGSRAEVARRIIEAILEQFKYDPNQLRDHKGRWTKGARGAATGVIPNAAETLNKGVASGIRKRSGLSGGDMALVDLVEFNDGSQAVRKVTRGVPSGRSPKDQNDAEELAAKVAQAVGVRAPAVHRVSNNEIFMEYEADRSPGNTFPSWRRDDFYATPDGLRMGLLDALIDNGDRHAGNYLVSDDGKNLTAIDHGFAWDPEAFTHSSPFVKAIQGRSNPFSPEDMAAVRPQLEGLRGEFERTGHGDWHDYMMEIFDELEQRASGTERLIP